MKTPIITVYITNYNYEKYLKQAIESVLSQTLQDFELFIIDDGSTDNSKEIIESFSSLDQVTVIYQQNKGLNITNNIALRLSKGKYIMRLDADDYLKEDALQSMVSLLEADDDLGMVFPDYYLVDAKNEITAEIRRHDFESDVQLLDQPAHGACTVIRTDSLRSVGGYDESYSCQDGYELWIKFIAKYKVTNVDKLLFFYRQHGANLTSNENRILDTRRSINDNFIINNDIKLPKTIAILPIRGTKLNGEFLFNTKLGGKRLIDIKLENLLSSKVLDLIVVTSSEPALKKLIEKNYQGQSKIMYVDRPAELERFNVSLEGTIDYLLAQPEIKKYSFEAFMILPLEYVFLSGSIIDDAINALEIFNSDSLISVRPESTSLYQHHGNGMVPILEQANFTQLEREALFKATGGVHLVKVDKYLEQQKTLPGKVGHIVVDSKTAHGIFSAFDLEVAKLLIKTDNLVLK